MAWVLLQIYAESQVKEFLKSVNISQGYEWISSGTFFMAHGMFDGGHREVMGWAW